MNLVRLPFHADLPQYESQAAALLEAYRAGDPEAIQLIHQRHPRFLDEKTPWLPKDVSDEEIRGAGLDLADARMALARWYDFRDWPAVAAFAAEAADENSAVFRFEAAVEAVVAGDLPALRSLLREDPELVRARSTRVTPFDPFGHRAMLLHYVAANGVEGYRQKTPPNAVEVAKTLLEAGAEPDALADLYGGRCTTMSLLVSSAHPAQAGVQAALADTLLDFGASLGESGEGNWTSPLMTALAVWISRHRRSAGPARRARRSSGSGGGIGAARRRRSPAAGRRRRGPPSRAGAGRATRPRRDRPAVARCGRGS